MNHDELDDSSIRQILEETRRIAIVGLSPKPDRASHRVAQFLLDKGYDIVPVHPAHSEILGLTCYPDLQSVPGQIDMVDLFQRAENVPPFVEAAIELGAKTVWMQLDIVHQEAAGIARAAGLQVVMDRCPKIEYQRLLA